MVVVQTQPSTSTNPHKKNRRKMSKKKAPETAAPADHDAEMVTQEEPPSAEVTAAAQAAIIEQENTGTNDDELMIDTDPTSLPSETSAPAFPPLPASAQRTSLKSETRRIAMPPHRMTPLKKDWVNIFGPLTEMLGLQVRMNVPRKCVEIRVSI